MIKKVFTDYESNCIFDRLKEGARSKGKDGDEIISKYSFEFGFKLATLTESALASIMNGAAIVQNEKDELIVVIPVINLTEICAKENLM